MRDLFIDASFAFPEVDRNPPEPCKYLKILPNLAKRECRGTISCSNLPDQQQLLEIPKQVLVPARMPRAIH